MMPQTPDEEMASVEEEMPQVEEERPPVEEPSRPFVVDGALSAEPERCVVREEDGLLWVVNQHGTRKDGPWLDNEAGRALASARAEKRTRSVATTN